MNNLELRHLRTLQAIKRHGQLAKAAESLHLTQSAISHQISTLEHQLDTELFRRGTRPLMFSAAGQVLLELAEEILPKVDAADERVKRVSAGSVGKLHIGFECHSCFDWLIPTLNHFQAQWEDIEVDMTLGFSFAPYPALLRGDLDVVITSDPLDHKDIDYFPLFKYQTVLAVSLRHALAKKKWVEPTDLYDETLITYPVDPDRLDIVKRFLKPNSVNPKNIRTAELTLMILQLVACGQGVAGLPNWTIPNIAVENIKTLKLGKAGTWGTLYVAMRKQDSALSYMQSFLSSAREISVTELTGIKKISKRK